MSKKKRSKIRYCYEDYCRTITLEERQKHTEKFAPLIKIIYTSMDDQEVITRAREYDTVNDTDIFSEAINFTIYCIACHRVDCIC